MTDRKPPGMNFTSWIDKQIAEATERGAFDNLPGSGKPIPHHGDEDAGQAWLREYLRKEGVSADVLLPAPLRLRKEAARLAELAPRLSSEQEVREAAAELNRQIIEWRRIPVGPAIHVPLVNADKLAESWRAAQFSASGPAAGQGTPAPPTGQVARSRWWRRRRGRG